MKKSIKGLHFLKNVVIAVLVGTGLTWATIWVLTATVVIAQEPTSKPQLLASENASFIWHFDPTLQQFETITLPTITGDPRPRRPHSVAVNGNDIWYTDPGVDRIGRLTYTGTNNYHFDEFSLATNSHPYDIAVSNSGEVWFTASEGDWIGKLDMNSSTTLTFATTANSRPWSIAVDSVGDVWFVEKQANKLGYLTLNGLNPPTLLECEIPQVNSHPEDLALNQNNMFLSLEAPTGQKTLFRGEWTPAMVSSCADIAIQSFTLLGDPKPFKLALKGLDLWFTETNENRVDNFVQGTFPRPIPYDVPTANSQPYDIRLDSSNNAWFSERIGAKLGKVDTSGQTVQILEYPVPTGGQSVWLQGLDIDAAGGIWLAGFTPGTVHLPIVLK